MRSTDLAPMPNLSVSGPAPAGARSRNAEAFRRRQFMLVACAAAAAPSTSVAQSVDVPTVAYLSASTANSTTVEAFQEGLRELGYVDGRNVRVEFRWADGQFDRLPALAGELVRLGVKVIVAANTPAALAAKRATSTIPIVLVRSGDPVGSGLVASLAHPGGNITGLSLTPTPAISGKQLELLKEAIPSVSHVAVLANPANPPTSALLDEVVRAARSIRLRLSVFSVRRPEEFEDVFTAMRRERVPTLLVIADPLVNDNRSRIVAFAAATRIPAVYPYRTFVDAGGLMSYGADISHLDRRSATYVDRLLKGAKPAEMPIEQPTKFELVVSMKTAKALGLAIPRSVLLRADQVIP